LTGEFWKSLKAWWATGESHGEKRSTLVTAALTLSFVKEHYEAGVPADIISPIDPATYNFDYLQNIAPIKKREIMLDLLYDYGTNVELYPAFQKYFRETPVPLLAVWGKNDALFVYPGAEAFKRDVKNAKVEFLDGGHFLLETHIKR